MKTNKSRQAKVDFTVDILIQASKNQLMRVPFATDEIEAAKFQAYAQAYADLANELVPGVYSETLV